MSNELTKTFAESNNGKPFYQDIVDYRSDKTDAATKARQDAIIATVDTDDLSSITALGKESAAKLQKSADDVLKETTNASAFLGAFGGLKEKLKTFDFNAVQKQCSAYLKQLDRAAAKGIVKFWYALTGVFRSKTTMSDITHEIDKSLLELADVVAALETAKAKIPEIQQHLKTLEQARLTAYSDFGLDIGAGVEKLLRIEEALPALRKEAAGSPLKLAEMSNLEDAYTTLNTQLTNMDQFHKISLGQLKTVNDLQKALVMCEQKIDSHLNLSQSQWKTMLAEASVAAQVGKIGETITDADTFGQKVFEQSQNVADLTRAMVQSSYGQGTLRPDKVVAFLQKKTTEIAEDLKFIDAHNARMIEQRAALDKAGQDLVAAATTLRETQPVRKITATAKIASEGPST